MGGAASAIESSLPERLSWEDIQLLYDGHPCLNTSRFQLYADQHDLKVSKQLLRRLSTTMYDVFLTHNWTPDELQRNNHQRVSHINSVLKRMGLITWFDEERVSRTRDEQACGLEGAEMTACLMTCATDARQHRGPDERGHSGVADGGGVRDAHVHRQGGQ